MTSSAFTHLADMRLCVNVDHVATVRQARGTDEPDPVPLLDMEGNILKGIDDDLSLIVNSDIAADMGAPFRLETAADFFDQQGMAQGTPLAVVNREFDANVFAGDLEHGTYSQ